MSTATIDIQDFGRRLHTWGASVTAIRARTKQPAHKWKRWQTQPQTRPELDNLPWHGAAAVGVVNGSGNFRIFDIDAVKDANGRPIAPVPESVAVDLLNGLELPDDYQWSYLSGSGAGWGVVIRCPEALPPEWTAEKGVYIGKPKDGREFDHLELRWATGQTVIDGAHPTGPGYKWRLNERPFVPPALLTAAQVVNGFRAIADYTATVATKNGTTPAHENGAARATGKYGAAALADSIRQVSTATPGDRNNALFRQTAGLAELVNGGVLTRPDVERAMTGAALAAGLPADATATTVASAFKNVGNTARQPSPNGHGEKSAARPADSKSDPAAGTSADGAAAICDLSYRPEDGGIMDVWHDLHGDEWIYATGFEEWYRFTGTHHQPDVGSYALKSQIAALMDTMNQQARTMRANVIAAMNQEAQSLKDKGVGKEAIKDAMTAYQGDLKKLSAYVGATSRTAARVASVEGLARLRCYIAANRLDAADVLNLANGSLDLNTLRLRPHDRRDLLTYCLPYEYDPAADAPHWDIVMERIEPATADFLQEYAGYSLTPDCRYEIALWLYGPPGRGASTMLAGWQAMLGAKATLLGLADIERNQFALSGLPGKTLAVATEQPADYIKTTNVINALISGEPVKVDRKFKEAVDIVTRVKLAWAMNELPRVKGANDGIFRRVKVVTFPAISEHERRPELKEAVKTEAAGILNWALAGLQRLRARGRFVIPATIEAASRKFAESNDIPAAFIMEQCYTGPEYKAQSQALYNAYHSWCIATGHKPQSLMTIAGDWERLGFEKVKEPAGMFWHGVGLKAAKSV